MDSAARWYVEGFSKRSRIEVRVHTGEIAERLPREVELALFPVFQEALTNVRRHANARSVDVENSCEEGNAILVVRDDGNGAAGDVLARFRAGLAGGYWPRRMQERLVELGGALDVQSGESGSVVQATPPVAACHSNDARAVNAITPLSNL
jgi:signal transduction histidine kinase